MAGLSDGLRMLARAVRHTPGAGEIPSHDWATVAAVSPVRVVLDLDETQQPREVTANAVGVVGVGQRVRVEMQGKRLTIVGSAPAPWITPALLNGWEHYSLPTGSFAQAAYRMLPHGVQLRGLIHNGTAGQPAFLVPAEGIDKTLILYSGSGSQMCEVRVNSDGQVTPSAGALPSEWVGLDGLIIPTD